MALPRVRRTPPGRRRPTVSCTAAAWLRKGLQPARRVRPSTRDSGPGQGSLCATSAKEVQRMGPVENDFLLPHPSHSKRFLKMSRTEPTILATSVALALSLFGSSALAQTAPAAAPAVEF